MFIYLPYLCNLKNWKIYLVLLLSTIAGSALTHSANRLRQALSYRQKSSGRSNWQPTFPLSLWRPRYYMPARPLRLVSTDTWRHQKRAKKTRILPTFFRLYKTTKSQISQEIFNFMKNLLYVDWNNIIWRIRICWEFGCTFCFRKINSNFVSFLMEKLQQKILNISCFEL